MVVRKDYDTEAWCRGDYKCEFGGKELSGEGGRKMKRKRKKEIICRSALE